MTIKVYLPREAAEPFRQMAKDAGVGLHDMAEIAIFNLIALWQKDREIGIQPLDPHDALDGDK